MVICIKAVSKIIKLVVLVNLLGMMEDIIKVNGKNNEMHGKGIFCWINGQVFEGNY
jgi:hypothetical protein